jgi:hemoglobin
MNVITLPPPAPRASAAARFAYDGMRAALAASDFEEDSMPERLTRFALPFLLSIALSACQSMAPPPPASLYDRLGGQPAITAVVDDFVANVAADNRINAFFARTDIPRLKRLLVEQICSATGGPCTYSGRTMSEAHRGMHITDAQFGALVEDLQRSLAKFKVPAKEQSDLLTILGSLKPQIVGQ